MGYLIYFAMDQTLWCWQQTERCLSLFCSSSINSRSKLKWWGDHNAAFPPKPSLTLWQTTRPRHFTSIHRAVGSWNWSKCHNPTVVVYQTVIPLNPLSLQNYNVEIYLTCWRGWVCPVFLRMEYHKLFDTMHPSYPRELDHVQNKETKSCWSNT